MYKLYLLFYSEKIATILIPFELRTSKDKWMDIRRLFLVQNLIFWFDFFAHISYVIARVLSFPINQTKWLCMSRQMIVCDYFISMKFETNPGIVACFDSDKIPEINR